MAGTKENITLAMEKKLLKQARAIAAERGLSVSAFLSGELARLVEQQGEYRRFTDEGRGAAGIAPSV